MRTVLGEGRETADVEAARFRAECRSTEAETVTNLPVLIVRAIDSSFYEVATNDTRVLQNLKATFRDVRSA